MRLREIALQQGLAGRILWQFRLDIVWVFIFSLFMNLFTLTPTLYMMQIYDRVMLSQSQMSLLIISLVTAGLFMLMAFTDLLRSKILIVLGNKIEQEVSHGLFSACLSDFLKDKVHEPSEYLRALVEFKQFISGTALANFFDLVWSPVYLLIAFMLHPLLGWLCLLTIAIQIVLLVANHWQNTRATEHILESAAKPKQFLHANLHHLLPVHAMGYTDHFKNRWTALQTDTLNASHRARKQQQGIQFWSKLYRYMVQTLSLGAGAYLAIQGQISIGTMIAANVILSRALTPFDQITQIWPQWLAFLKANNTLSVLLTPTQAPQMQGVALPAVHAQPPEVSSVALQQFSAQYAADQAPVLHDVSLRLQAGDVVAVMGASGSGKTTLGKALLGLLPTTSGTVLVNDAAHDGSLLTAFTAVGYLPQDFQLFEGTVAENIARFSGLDAQAITQAAIQAGIHEWVLRLPKGYDTMIGPAGQGLSGGQKQQLGLARAIFGQSQLLVLDEPNSNLDEAGERALHQVLLQMAQRQAITLVISHREQVLGCVNKVLWLESGRVKAFGDKATVLPLMNA